MIGLWLYENGYFNKYPTIAFNWAIYQFAASFFTLYLIIGAVLQLKFVQTNFLLLGLKSDREMEREMFCEYKFFKAVTTTVIIFVVKSAGEEKCNLLLSSKRSLLSKVYLSIQITINLFVVGVTFIVVLNSEDLVSGLSDLPSMAYITEIDSFFGQYFMRYLNSHFPTVAKNQNFLQFKTSIRSMKASHFWSRITGSIWTVFGCV